MVAGTSAHDGLWLACHYVLLVGCGVCVCDVVCIVLPTIHCCVSVEHGLGKMHLWFFRNLTLI